MSGLQCNTSAAVWTTVRRAMNWPREIDSGRFGEVDSGSLGLLGEIRPRKNIFFQVRFGPSGPKLDLLVVTNEFGDPYFVGKHPWEFPGMCLSVFPTSSVQKCELFLDFLNFEKIKNI